MKNIYDDMMHCMICKKFIASHGQYNHAMAHVRREQAEVHTDLIAWRYGLNKPYTFTVKEREAEGGEGNA